MKFLIEKEIRTVAFRESFFSYYYYKDTTKVSTYGNVVDLWNFNPKLYPNNYFDETLTSATIHEHKFMIRKLIN